MKKSFNSRSEAEVPANSSLVENLKQEYQSYFEGVTAFEALKSYTTTELSDAMGGDGVMDYGIKAIASGTCIIGRAFTVQLPEQDSKLTLDAIDAAKPGDILVINTSSSFNHAVWGDVKTLMAMRRKIRGVIVDGSVRDISRNVELSFPIFCRHSVARASGKQGGGALQTPVSCGGVTVFPGDLICADDNGVVVIPASRLDDVLQKAKEKLKNDEHKINSILMKAE